MRLFDLTSQDYLRAPHEQLLAAMEEGPWAQTKLPFIGRLKLLLGHAECQALLKDQENFKVHFLGIIPAYFLQIMFKMGHI